MRKQDNAPHFLEKEEDNAPHTDTSVEIFRVRDWFARIGLCLFNIGNVTTLEQHQCRYMITQ